MMKHCIYSIGNGCFEIWKRRKQRGYWFCDNINLCTESILKLERFQQYQLDGWRHYWTDIKFYFQIKCDNHHGDAHSGDDGLELARPDHRWYGIRCSLSSDRISTSAKDHLDPGWGSTPCRRANAHPWK